ncbi:hypothetical protein QVD17_18047 [Tagetes erecta]|uniref:Uncharacterized protein n=1 Tax=Tagetes erecta TaxID=13708 RepID=A0AAD8NW07_TARER|nr:hypothetical protein QVD17_18047 [Tagetes erecta]
MKVLKLRYEMKSEKITKYGTIKSLIDAYGGKSRRTEATMTERIEEKKLGFQDSNGRLERRSSLEKRMRQKRVVIIFSEKNITESQDSLYIFTFSFTDNPTRYTRITRPGKDIYITISSTSLYLSSLFSPVNKISRRLRSRFIYTIAFLAEEIAFHLRLRSCSHGEDLVTEH